MGLSASSGRNLGSAFVRVRPDTSNFGNNVATQLRSELKKIDFNLPFSDLEASGRKLDVVGKNLVRSVATPIALVTAGLGVLGASFESTLNRVQAVSQATVAQREVLEDTARSLATSTKFTAREVGEAQEFLALAGSSVGEILGSLPSVLDLAAAGNVDLGKSADIVTNILAGQGLAVSELSNAVDVLTAAFTGSNTNLEQLGTAFSYVGSVSAQVGLSIEETAAALGLLGNAGIQASRAGTTLRGALAKLVAPTRIGATVLARLGVVTRTSSGELLPFVDILRQFEEVGLTAGDALQIFGQRAGPGVLALVSQGSEALAEFTERLEDSGGAAERIADIQLQGLTGSFLIAKSQIEEFGLTLFDSGIGDSLESLVRAFGEFFDTLGEYETLLKTTVALGGTTLALTALISVLGKAKIAFANFRNASFLVSGPAGAPTGAIAGYRNLRAEVASATGEVRKYQKQLLDGANVSSQLRGEQIRLTQAQRQLSTATKGLVVPGILLGTLAITGAIAAYDAYKNSISEAEKQQRIFTDTIKTDSIGAFNDFGSAGEQTEEAIRKVIEATDGLILSGKVGLNELTASVTGSQEAYDRLGRSLSDLGVPAASIQKLDDLREGYLEASAEAFVLAQNTGLLTDAQSRFNAEIGTTRVLLEAYAGVADNVKENILGIFQETVSLGFTETTADGINKARDAVRDLIQDVTTLGGFEGGLENFRKILTEQSTAQGISFEQLLGVEGADETAAASLGKRVSEGLAKAFNKNANFVTDAINKAFYNDLTGGTLNIDNEGDIERLRELKVILDGLAESGSSFDSLPAQDLLNVVTKLSDVIGQDADAKKFFDLSDRDLEALRAQASLLSQTEEAFRLSTLTTSLSRIGVGLGAFNKALVETDVTFLGDAFSDLVDNSSSALDPSALLDDVDTFFSLVNKNITSGAEQITLAESILGGLEDAPDLIRKGLRSSIFEEVVDSIDSPEVRNQYEQAFDRYSTQFGLSFAEAQGAAFTEIAGSRAQRARALLAAGAFDSIETTLEGAVGDGSQFRNANEALFTAALQADTAVQEYISVYSDEADTLYDAASDFFSNVIEPAQEAANELEEIILGTLVDSFNTIVGTASASILEADAKVFSNTGNAIKLLNEEVEKELKAAEERIKNFNIVEDSGAFSAQDIAVLVGLEPSLPDGELDKFFATLAKDLADDGVVDNADSLGIQELIDKNLSLLELTGKARLSVTTDDVFFGNLTGLNQDFYTQLERQFELTPEQQLELTRTITENVREALNSQGGVGISAADYEGVLSQTEIANLPDIINGGTVTVFPDQVALDSEYERQVNEQVSNSLNPDNIAATISAAIADAGESPTLQQAIFNIQTRLGEDFRPDKTTLEASIETSLAETAAALEAGASTVQAGVEATFNIATTGAQTRVTSLGGITGGFYLSGLTDGITNTAAQKQVADAGDTLATRLNSAVASNLEVRSPSRVAAELGGFYVAGLAEGIIGSTPAAVAAAEALAAGLVGVPMPLQEAKITATAVQPTFASPQRVNATNIDQAAFGASAVNSGPSITIQNLNLPTTSEQGTVMLLSDVLKNLQAG